MLHKGNHALYINISYVRHFTRKRFNGNVYLHDIARSLGWHSNNNTIQAGTSFDAYSKHVMIDSNTYKIADERPTSICKGELFFKYFELDSPYERMPFADKVLSIDSFEIKTLLGICYSSHQHTLSFHKLSQGLNT